MNSEDFPPMDIIPPKKKVGIVVKPDASPLDYFKAVYTNNDLPEGLRMRAASEAAKYVHAQKMAVATYAADGDLATRLDLALAAVREPKLIEAPPKAPPGRSPEEVSAEHMTKSFRPLRRRF